MNRTRSKQKRNRTLILARTKPITKKVKKHVKVGKKKIAKKLGQKKIMKKKFVQAESKPASEVVASKEDGFKAH